jgi:hypothetical protein
MKLSLKDIDPMVEVCNLKHGDFGKPGDIRCDRDTKWGNPFIMYYQDQRDSVCDIYEDYFEEIVKPNNAEFVHKLLKAGGLSDYQADRWMKKTGGFLDLSELKGAVRIFCWCSPRRCHCDYLKKRIEALAEPISLTTDNRI